MLCCSGREMPWFIISSWQVLAHSRRQLLPFLVRGWCYLIAQGGHSFQRPLLIIGNRRFITWESPLFQLTLLMLGARTNSSQGSSSLSGFLSHSNSQNCSEPAASSCCFSFLTLRGSWPSRLAVPDEHVLCLSHCLDVNVPLLLFDSCQRWLSKARIHSVPCSCKGASASPESSPCLQLGMQSVGIKGRETFYIEIHVMQVLTWFVGFLQCLVVLSVEGTIDVTDWKLNKTKQSKKG